MSVKRITVCKGCKNRIDPETCGCGDLIASHHFGSGHSPVPLGCACGYELSAISTARKVPSYSVHVRKCLDPQRPKYSQAVKTLGALAPNEQVFRVLVSRLDDACKEARTHNLSRLPGLIKLK